MYDDDFGPSLVVPSALKFQDVETLPLRELRERFSALAELARGIAQPGDLPAEFPHDFETSGRDELRAILHKYDYWFLSLAEMPDERALH